MNTKMRETSLQEIATLLQAKKDEGNPVVLFLGTRTGGLCHNQALYNSLSKYSVRTSTFDHLSDREKLDECYKILKGFTEHDIHNTFQEALYEIDPREEDYGLIKLLQQGFFSIVISTNIDNALDSLLENEGYTIVNIARFSSGGFAKNGISYSGTSSRQFFKVFGDLDSLSYTSVGNELDLNNKPDLKKFLASLLAKDVMVIGYDPMWDRAIDEAFPGEGGNIWYVDEERPPMRSSMSKIVTMRQGKYLLGGQGNYKGFVNALHRHLLGGSIQKPHLGNTSFPAKQSAEHNNGEDPYKNRQKNHNQNGVVNLAKKILTIHNAEERKRTKVFISYSHNKNDRRYLERLLVHLESYKLSVSNQKEALEEVWYDGLIKSGNYWRDEIEKALETTKVAVLLVSADFFSSEFITKIELPSLLKAARESEVVILPVILAPCPFGKSVLAPFQSVNDPSKPLIGMKKKEKEHIWSDVATRVHEMLPPLLETS